MSVARSLMLLTAAAVLAACGGGEPAPEPAAPSTSKPAAPAPAVNATAKPAPDMARAVVSGKPVAGVDLYYEIKGRPEIGQPVDIELLLTTTVGVDTLEASISGMEGLAVTGPESGFRAASLAAGDEVRHVITVVPAAGGVYYASLVVRTDGETGVQARTFAIPMVVGSATAAQKPTAAQTDATGERIRSLPARENGG